MASKFQNRLVGTIILVAVGVIVLPGLLDGKKKHYKEEFAAIPLVPKPDDQQDTDMVPPVTQSLPARPPQHAEMADQAPPAESSQAASGNSAPTENSEPSVVSPPPVQSAPPAAEKPASQPKSKPAEPPKAAVQKPAEQPKPVEQDVPRGQAWVVQLGALKNAQRVNEVVAQLRLSGYRAYTVPATPVQGQLTRIYVGPDASKEKMQASVSELKAISGLGGVVRAYTVR